jgi:hypothetical protein
MNRFEKLRRSAIFVAANVPWLFELGRSGIFVAANAPWPFKLRRSGIFDGRTLQCCLLHFSYSI